MTTIGRTLAIGDIHGCLDPLKLLWETINPQPNDHIIFVGDYVDRGPDTKGVIDFLIALKPQFNITFLTGNHEEKFFLATHGGSEIDDWIDRWGGKETLDSYGPNGITDVPESHWSFLRHCQPTFETDTHIFVHANLEADIPVANQPPFTLIHKKLGSPLPHQSGKTMICGHTAQTSHRPLNLGHAICIDTDPGRGGWLTCLDINTDKYWQTNIAGQTREGALELANSPS